MREKKAQRLPVFQERLEILFQKSRNSIAGYLTDVRSPDTKVKGAVAK